MSMCLRGWAELSQHQLRFLLTAMVAVNLGNKNVGYRSQEDYAAQTAAQVQTLCFFKWSGLTVVCPYDSGYLVRSGDMEFMLSAETVAAALSHLSWTKELPQEPVRLDSVDGANAIPADISSGLSFDAWLACETQWQRYQSNPDDALLRQMAEILYNKENISLTPAETLGVFYWWAGVKNLVSAMFPNFFKKWVATPKPNLLLMTNCDETSTLRSVRSLRATSQRRRKFYLLTLCEHLQSLTLRLANMTKYVKSTLQHD